DERFGKLADADKGVGWHVWQGKPIRRRIGRLLSGKRITFNDIELLEYTLRDPAKAAILTDKKKVSEELEEEQRIYDIVMEVLGKQWNEPNARISVPMENYDNWVGNLHLLPAAERPQIDTENPYGYEKSIRKFGGRQPSTEPLVRILTSPQMALYDAMMSRSLKTAAEEKVIDATLDHGEDPIAQKPFFSTTIGRYFAHLLDRAKKTNITYAHNNFFRQHRDKDGKIIKGFVWPGFSANSRIDVWLIKYRLGQLRDDEYVETPVGLIPTPEASIFDGLRVEDGGTLTRENIIDLTTFDRDEWRWEIQVRTNFIINKLKMDIPDELRQEHEKLAKALDYTLPKEWYQAKAWDAMEAEKDLQDAAVLAEQAERRGPAEVVAEVDEALTVQQRERPETTGGIDFNPELLEMQIKRDGEGIPLPVLQQPSEVLQNINGFVPVIIDMTPVPNLPLILGLSDMEEKIFAATEGEDQQARERGARPQPTGERLSRLYE
ncbi:MAG: phosphoenolpyruvate carboxykinase (GTP), partial [Candidatus Omnitrophica bacterium]|nr:phosphoenolpyruvate carboxykinase (GTP) [Candidatus Omnitrophota bacterium]